MNDDMLYYHIIYIMYLIYVSVLKYDVNFDYPLMIDYR